VMVWCLVADGLAAASATYSGNGMLDAWR
jgi:hypothetical protein